MRQLSASLAVSFLVCSCISSEPSLQVHSKDRYTGNDGARVSVCSKAFARGEVCAAANQRALDLMNAGGLEAVTVIQNVATGALLAFAASKPSELDVNKQVRPLSLCKLLLAACWFDNQQPDSHFETGGAANAQNPASKSAVSVHEMLVGGSDSAGRELAVALRRSLGTKKVLENLGRYGFAQQVNSAREDAFWGELSSTWQKRLIPPPAYASLSDQTSDADWAETLSLGEVNMGVTALQVSRFLQAIGNDGVMLAPAAREEGSSRLIRKSPGPVENSIRVMQPGTALQIQSGMFDCVRRGTVKSIAEALKDTGWQIGGKTGSGPALLPKGAQLDGWFAGIVFDPQSKARFTVATFVRSGGYGGDNAARVSAEIARYIIAENHIQ